MSSKMVSRRGTARRAPTAFLALALLCAAAPAFGGPFADSVVSFTPGTNAGFGQSALPGVVLGPPQGGGEVQGSLDVLSLGNNGVIVLGFDVPVICDGPGPDLTVFENAFHQGTVDGPLFAEYGIVAVSQDGVNFITFPYDPVTHFGLAGQTPVLSNSGNGISPLDPSVSGGDQFDLADVGLTWAKYVRITDPGASIDDPGSHIVPPGTTAGFDLDALAALHACDPSSQPSPTPTVTVVQTASPTATPSSPPPPTPTSTSTVPATATATATLPVTATATAPPTAHDAAVLPRRPVHVHIGRGQLSATKRVRIKVRNADPTGSVPIQLTASGCEMLAATSSVDFGRHASGAPDTALVRAGKNVSGIVSVSVPAASVTTPDRKAPGTCVLTLTATAVIAGNVDPTPADNSTSVELLVLDANDFE
jgi:hypothetical protein